MAPNVSPGRAASAAPAHPADGERARRVALARECYRRARALAAAGALVDAVYMRACGDEARDEARALRRGLRLAAV